MTKKQIVLVVFLMISTFLLGVGSFYLFEESSNNNSNQNEDSEERLGSQDPLETSLEDDRIVELTYKTYTDESLGIALQYPSTWDVSTNTETLEIEYPSPAISEFTVIFEDEDGLSEVSVTYHLFPIGFSFDTLPIDEYSTTKVSTVENGNEIIRASNNSEPNNYKYYYHDLSYDPSSELYSQLGLESNIPVLHLILKGGENEAQKANTVHVVSNNSKFLELADEFVLMNL